MTTAPIYNFPEQIQEAFARGEEVTLFTAWAECRLEGNPETHDLHSHIQIDADPLTPWQRALAARLQQALNRPIRRIPKKALRTTAEIQRSTNAPSLDLFTLRCTVQQDAGTTSGRLAVEVSPEVNAIPDIQVTAEKALQRCRAAVKIGGISC